MLEAPFKALLRGLMASDCDVAELDTEEHIPTSTMARSRILRAMRGDAALGSTVHDAVVTAPREVLPKDLLAG